jgi:hypothetical protein
MPTGTNGSVALVNHSLLPMTVLAENGMAKRERAAVTMTGMDLEFPLLESDSYKTLTTRMSWTVVRQETPTSPSESPSSIPQPNGTLPV